MKSIDNISALNEADFLKGYEDSGIQLHTLTNKNGCVVQITNYGARLVSLWVPDKNGAYRDVVLGHATLKEYMDSSPNYYGATCGRFANRIAKGKFELDGKTYQLATNNGENHLHGGTTGFESVAWEIEKVEEQSVTFSYLSKDGEAGYPGNLQVSVRYSLTDQNELGIEYHATTDQPTILNLTNHAYFNLKGEGEGDILDHEVQIASEKITELRDGSMPTGRLLDVTNTPFDFNTAAKIGSRINDPHEQLEIGGGYDHNYVLDGPENAPIALVNEPESGIVMQVYTDEPGVQFYTTNSMSKVRIGKTGKTYIKHGAFCLETQHFPDSPNQATFPSVVLRPGEQYHSQTTYQFFVK